VLASPVRVPLPTNEIAGHVYSEAADLLRSNIRDACGGTQCVDVAKKANSNPDDDLDDPCDLVDSAENTEYTDDGSGVGTVTVPRDGTIYLLVNIPCEDRPATGGSSGTEDQPTS